GELVEIGGEFRIPEVMEKSGARLHEVGTTNRTRLQDYEKALCDATGVILKVHTSNFKILGFTEETGLVSLTALGNKHSVPVVCDLGSGCLIDLNRYGLEKEPTVQEILTMGVDVVTFSGDKLLGGPQAGIILGKADTLAKIKKNPLNRAVRIDKLTLAALEATVLKYLQEEEAVKSIPVLCALTEPVEGVRQRAKKLLSLLKRLPDFTAALRQGSSLAGGGALPTCEIPTVLIACRTEHCSAAKLEAELRKLEIPIIARIVDDEVLFDLRTIDAKELPLIRDGMRTVLENLQ
ncbi:MAG: L-seryl-tRNA(Sec) selenium transferase, partial [Syntrophales bacterium LBB04]|nr:L-seryl-tRNA(Sec) selenium transferase [Syntrophales bacterium LBB04]